MLAFEPQAVLKADEEISYAISSNSLQLLKETSWLVELLSEDLHNGHVLGKVSICLKPHSMFKYREIILFFSVIFAERWYYATLKPSSHCKNL